VTTSGAPLGGGVAAVPAGRIMQRGRAKAYRPLTSADRSAALRSGLEAYERGDFFLAHERLEPAWMGTADPAERDLYQGLIKLAAGFVHAVRGNPAGLAANLRGARLRLQSAIDGDAPDVGLDVGRLLVDVGDRLATAESMASAAPAHAPRHPGEPPRRPLPIEPPAITRRAR
jgi:predicted metal-dependent hydrolase